jgi:uncharacterized repeat protein (TIGR01451 family)
LNNVTFATGDTFSVDISVTPASTATLNNPDPGVAGICYAYEPAPPDFDFDLANNNCSNSVTVVAAAPEMDLRDNADTLDIPDGDTTPIPADGTHLGATPVAGGTVSSTFRIENNGTANLTLTNPFAIGGANPGDFSVTSPATTPVAAGGFTNFTVQCDPSAAGVRTADISIANNDSGENPYSFRVQCYGGSHPTFEKAFNPAAILTGGTSTLTFTVTNPNALALTGLNFSDSFPADLQVAAVPNYSTTCTGVTLTSGDTAGDTTFVMTAGQVAASSSCTLQVDVTSSTPGTHTNTTGTIGSAETGAGTDTATGTLTVSNPTLTVNVVNPFGADNVDSVGGTPNPGAINCPGGAVCAASFNLNDTPTLSVTVDAASGFLGWGGDCAAFGAALSGPITMNADKTCTATFAGPPPPPGGPPIGGEEIRPVPQVLPGDTDFVEKTVDRAVAGVGNVLTYTVRFANPKDVPLTQVMVQDVFDSRLDNVTLVSHSKGNGSVSGNTVTVDGFELAPGEQMTLVVRATISNRAGPGDVISNFATLDSPDASVHASNTVRTTIVGELPDTGYGPPDGARREWLPLALIAGGLLALLGLDMQRRFVA